MTIIEDKGLVSVTIILPVMDEVVSQEKTLAILERDFGIDQQLIIVVCEKTTNESLEVARHYASSRKGVELLWQSRPYLGGAIQDAIARVKTTHYLIMASDLETHPSDAIRLWEMAQRNPTHIIVGSRWLNPKSFTDYGKFRLLANRLFQNIMSGMWHQYITDYTFGFRVVPMRYGGKISPTALKHEYLLESFLLMLKLGAEVIEIPTKWSARIEGDSHNVFTRNTKYLMTAVKVKLGKSKEKVDWS